MSDPEADGPDAIDAEVVEEPTSAVAPAPGSPALPEPDYTDAGVPTFDYVRDQIEKRYTTSAGATELAGLGTENDLASLDKKLEDRDQAARDKLAEIRRSMGKE
ncbi:hypothetical protein CFN78_21365 [Amycolatopsis antarctica]|uniref:PspA domain-containing protein n=1 Tax=Amycolatopsis antarctica TaxID=1854586 RepID=A0A263D1E1_9PSEU|nr:hypothetical protein [Amycolatopsis antarctica]OZM71336.1 hypothetical protein CFN78_21365 [Amycolatopsis antarctica]